MIDKRTAVEAYCLAFPAKAQTQSRETLSVAAHKLKNKPEIKERISSGESLVALAKERTAWTKARRLELIEDIVNEAYQDRDYKICLQGLELAGKLCGDLAPQKLEVEHSAIHYSFNVLTNLAQVIEQQQAGQIIEGQTIDNPLLE